jgi:hypothetical protein
MKNFAKTTNARQYRYKNFEAELLEAGEVLQ